MTFFRRKGGWALKIGLIRMCYVTKLSAAINSLFKDKYALIKGSELLSEEVLLAKLDVQSNLRIQPDKRSSDALFGYRTVTSDFRSLDCDHACIEFKRIGLNCQRTRNGNPTIVPRENECDLKNGRAQIIEQAYCKSATVALFVVIDGGRACDRAWNEGEKQFIQMFKDNPFGITLSVIRIRLIHANRSIICETF